MWDCESEGTEKRRASFYLFIDYKYLCSLPAPRVKGGGISSDILLPDTGFMCVPRSRVPAVSVSASARAFVAIQGRQAQPIYGRPDNLLGPA